MVAVAQGSELERILGRPVWRIPVEEPLRWLRSQRVVITGAAGSIGEALSDILGDADAWTHATDIDTLDVRDPDDVDREFVSARPTVVFHLAGAKHAPDGELDPAGVMGTNAGGTQNVLDAANGDARVVLASTCKACDPETVYGASKLIAERMVLAAGGSVARFYNVVETSGNVFETWRGLAEGDPVPASHCERFFITVGEAVALLLWAAVMPAGRYAVAPGPSRLMIDVADALYPDREVVAMLPRRGDRRCEPLIGSSEHAATPAGHPRLMRITSPHEAAA